MPEVSIHGPSSMLSWDLPLRSIPHSHTCLWEVFLTKSASLLTDTLFQVFWRGVGLEHDVLFLDQSSEPESQGRAVSVKDVASGARSPLISCGALQNQ